MQNEVSNCFKVVLKGNIFYVISRLYDMYSMHFSFVKAFQNSFYVLNIRSTICQVFSCIKNCHYVMLFLWLMWVVLPYVKVFVVSKKISTSSPSLQVCNCNWPLGQQKIILKIVSCKDDCITMHKQKWVVAVDNNWLVRLMTLSKLEWLLWKVHLSKLLETSSTKVTNHNCTQFCC